MTLTAEELKEIEVEGAREEAEAQQRVTREAEEERDMEWFIRYLAHEQGVDVGEDPYFGPEWGPWDEEDEALAVELREKVARALAAKGGTDT